MSLVTQFERQHLKMQCLITLYKDGVEDKKFGGEWNPIDFSDVCGKLTLDATGDDLFEIG